MTKTILIVTYRIMLISTISVVCKRITTRSTMTDTIRIIIRTMSSGVNKFKNALSDSIVFPAKEFELAVDR
jgi:hypothetical protein